MGKERFEVFGKIIKDNEDIPALLDNYLATVRLNELNDKVKELKQELAELKEKDNYHLRYELAGADETITNLKKQLAEKDIRIEELEGQFAYECECNKQLVELQKQLEEKQNTIDEINKEFVQAVHDWKALCAEKDKEISRLKERLSVFDNFKDNYGYTNYDDSEILEDLQSRAFQAEDDTQVVNELLQFFNIFDENELVDKVKEPQTQLAIQELEKVKDTLKHFCNIHNDEYYGVKSQVKGIEQDVCDQINQQIKELKGEKE